MTAGREASALREPVGTRYADENGWNGPHSVATTAAARDTVSRLVVIPSNDGGLVVTLWGSLEVEINVDPDGQIGLVMVSPPARETTATAREQT